MICSHAGEPVLPLLKWPGGKRWAAPRIAEIVGQALRGRYFEPFLGGGAVFFHLRPGRAVLSDINEELIVTYEAVRDRPAAVLRAVQRLPVREDDYYRIRAHQPRSSVDRAARLLYLNRTCFSGIFRLNRQGQFNVPYGGGSRTPAPLWTDQLLERAAAALDGAEVRQSDFEVVMEEASAGDVVYCDPTYTVMHDRNGFVRYNERNFSWSDQERLSRVAKRAASRGATVVVSNAHHRMVRALYAEATTITLKRKSRVSARPEGRRAVTEYLFVLNRNSRRARRLGSC